MTDKPPQMIARPRSRVLLVDDHAPVRQQLAGLLQAQADLVVCGEAEDAPTARELIRQQAPDLVILDLSLKRSSGLDLLENLKELQPKPAVLVLSMHEEAFYVERALQAGAMGYITKQGATVNFLAAVRRVLGGQVYLNGRIAERMRQRRAGRALAGVKAGCGETGVLAAEAGGNGAAEVPRLSHGGGA